MNGGRCACPTTRHSAPWRHGRCTAFDRRSVWLAVPIAAASGRGTKRSPPAVSVSSAPRPVPARSSNSASTTATACRRGCIGKLPYHLVRRRHPRSLSRDMPRERPRRPANGRNADLLSSRAVRRTGRRHRHAAMCRFAVRRVRRGRRVMTDRQDLIPVGWGPPREAPGALRKHRGCPTASQRCHKHYRSFSMSICRSPAAALGA